MNSSTADADPSQWWVELVRLLRERLPPQYSNWASKVLIDLLDEDPLPFVLLLLGYLRRDSRHAQAVEDWWRRWMPQTGERDIGPHRDIPQDVAAAAVERQAMWRIEVAAMLGLDPVRNVDAFVAVSDDALREQLARRLGLERDAGGGLWRPREDPTIEVDSRAWRRFAGALFGLDDAALSVTTDSQLRARLAEVFWDAERVRREDAARVDDGSSREQP